MKMYVNVMPFRINCSDEFIEVGTTFVAIGADQSGLALRQASKISSPNAGEHDVYIMPEIINHAFKPVMEIEQCSDLLPQ